MTSQTLNAVLGWSQVAAFFYACIFLPFRYVLRTGRFRRGVLIIWISASVFALCSVMLGQYLYSYVDRSLVEGCFEGPQFLAFALMGWLSPGMLVSGIAYLLFWRRQRLLKKQESNKHEAAA
jgi:ABC-type tungstate transport system substrate-binding protein